MAGGIDWFRWHHGSVNDPKFQLVAKQADASVAEVVAVWASLLEAASQAEDRGNPGRPDFESMDCALGLPEGRAEAIYVRLGARGMVGADGSITAWDRRQPKREDESAAERKRRQREREAQGDTQGHDESRSVTPTSRDVTQCHDREEESREEEISSSLGSEETGASKSRPPRPKREAVTLATYLTVCKAEGKKPLPPDHPVRGYCRDAGITEEMLQVAWCVFRDDYTTGTNKARRYKDWPGHFANAVRGCWAKLWFTDAGEVKWSSRGLQERQVLEARQRSKEHAHVA